MSKLGRMGRFGNQVFQYAFLKIYAKIHQLDNETSRWIGQDLFGHDDPGISQKLKTIHLQNILTKSEFAKNMYTPGQPPFINVNFHGSCQYHPSYYVHLKKYFRSLFQPIPQIKTEMDRGLQGIQNKTIVAFHLRRGDFGGRGLHWIAPTGWYINWLNQVWEMLDNPVLYIASDQLEKVLHDFRRFHPITYHDLGMSLPDAAFFPDYYILTQANYLAISNSTFSYSASMLNEKAELFLRPHLIKGKLISYNPWDSPVALRFESSPR